MPSAKIHAWTFYRAKPISSVHVVLLVCSRYPRMATDACVKRAGGACRECFVEAADHGQRYEGEASMLLSTAGLRNLHVVLATWSALCCDSAGVLRVWMMA